VGLHAERDCSGVLVSTVFAVVLAIAAYFLHPS